MKSKNLVFLLLLSFIVLNSCEKESKHKLTVKNFGVLALSDTAPTKVLVNYSLVNCGEFTKYHPGAYKSFSPADTTNQATWMGCGDGSYTTTDTLFYLYPGTYQVEIRVKGGETFPKSFVLMSSDN